MSATVPTGASAKDLVPAADFDVREFARTAVGSHRSRVNLLAYGSQPLAAESISLVDCLAQFERSTLRYLRGVLVTPTHKDARVTAFLVTWAYEKYWIADVLEAIVDAHPQVRIAHMPAGRARYALRSINERIEPIRESIVANALGEDVIAVHTMTGAVDDWTMQAAYHRLAQESGNPELERTIAGICSVKERHSAFFAAQSRDRLARSPGAARLARRRLSRVRFPLGSGDQPPAVTARFYRSLFDAESVGEIDSRVDSYPGLSGLRPVHRSVARLARSIRR